MFSVVGFAIDVEYELGHSYVAKYLFRLVSLGEFFCENAPNQKYLYDLFSLENNVFVLFDNEESEIASLVSLVYGFEFISATSISISFLRF